MNPVYDTLEWLKFTDDTKSTKVKASEKSCNWAAYYQENIVQKLQMPCSSVPLPLINENINSPAMVNHFMTVIQKVVRKVNPGQIPIILLTSHFTLYLNKYNRNF